MELPGGGAVATLWAGEHRGAQLAVLEQTTSAGPTYRWLCAGDAVLTVAQLEPAADAPSARTRHAVPRFVSAAGALLPAYHRAMIAALALSTAPPRAFLLAGCAGGALARCLGALHPRTRLTGLEPDGTVRELAARFFGARPSPRFDIRPDGLLDHLRRCPRARCAADQPAVTHRCDLLIVPNLRYDAIFVDACELSDGSAPPGSLCSADAIRAVRAPPSALSAERSLLPEMRHAVQVRRALTTAGGVLIINVHCGASRRARLLRVVREEFSRDIVEIATAEGNVVLVAHIGGRTEAVGAVRALGEFDVIGAG